MVILMALFGFGLALGDVPWVCAQETQAEDFTLEEITVTAEKREMNVQKTAMSVMAVTGENITEKSILSLQDALSNMAGVNVQGIPQGGSVFIRGVGSTIDANATDPSVSVSVDNMYLGRTEAMYSSMYDIERVEVLRGPQGTIYGRNAAGGQINVISKKPTDKFEGNASLTLGNYNLRSAQAAVNVPFSDKWAARFAVNKETRDGYISDGSSSSDKFAVRGKLSFKPTDKLSFLLSVELSRDKSSPSNTVPVPGSAGKLPKLGAPTTYGYVDDVYTTGWVIPSGSDAWTQDAYHPKPYSNLRFNFYQLDIDWDLGWGLLKIMPTFNTSYRDLWSEMMFGTSRGGTIAQQDWEETQLSVETRLQNAEDSAINWMVGAYYLDKDNKRAHTTASALTYMEQSALSLSKGQNGWIITTTDVPIDYYALYGQVTYPVTDRLRLTGSIRYNEDNRGKDYQLVNYNIPDPNNEYYDDAVITSDGRHEFDSGIVEYRDSPKIMMYKGGVDFDLAEDKMLYAYVTTGYKAGNMNKGYPLSWSKPEENISYSVGSKNRFMNGQLQANFEAFYYDYKNYQIDVTINEWDSFLGQMGSSSKIRNAGAQAIKGFDVDMDYMITANDTINASAEYLSATWGKMVVGASTMLGLDSDFELTGYDMPNSPKWSGTLGYEHIFYFDNGGRLTSRIQTKYSQGYYTTHQVYLAGAWQDEYHMSDLYLTYYTPSDKYSVGLWSKNLENAAVTVRTLPAYRRQIAAPRTYGMTVSVKF